MSNQTEKSYQNDGHLDQSQLLHELAESQKARQALTKAKSNFLSNISHEFFTPMNSILGFINLNLEDYKLSKDHEHMLNVARHSANSLLRLINNIIDISNIEKGAFTIEKKVFSLPILLEQTIKFLDLRAKRKALFLNLTVDDSCKKNYIGDPTRLSQTLSNIIGNAIKFTEKGGITVNISLEKTNPDTQTDTILFSISDTGIGMSKDRLNTIFEPFTQIDESSGRHRGGTGLSATLAKRLVDLMNGQLLVESVLGKGSTFSVQLDFPISIGDVEEVGTEKDDTQEIARVYHVLIVDDQELNTDLLKHRLELAGHSAVTAANGREAIKAFQQDSFDAIFMDVQMPIMGGLEATREIRMIEQNENVPFQKQIPIIALTGSISRENFDSCLQAGMNSIVGKPIDFSLLFATMEHLIPSSEKQNVVKQTTQSKTEAEFKLPDLAGIDVKQALLTWIDPGIYTKALIKFSHDYSGVTDEIAAFVEENNISEIKHIAHTLQGLSGNLSMPEVYSLTMQINTAAKGNSLEEVQKLVEPLRLAINEVVSSIQGVENSFPTQQEPQSEQKRRNSATVKKHLRLLYHSCLQSDPDDVEFYFEKIKGSIRSEYLYVLSGHIEQFEFDEAVKVLAKMAESLNIELNPQ